MGTLRLITAPEVLPLTLQETKEHLRVTISTDDTLISAYIEGVTSFVEKFLGRALVTQTWEYIIDEFPLNHPITLPLSPVQSITSIKYDDTGGTEQTLDVSGYRIDLYSEPARIDASSAGWPTPFDGIGSVRVRFVAGYAPSSDSPPDLRANIPRGIKAGLLLHIGSLYENREEQVVGTSIAKLPVGAEWILRHFRVAVPLA